MGPLAVATSLVCAMLLQAVLCLAEEESLVREIQHKSSGTDYILIAWNVTDGLNISGFEIQSTKQDSDTIMSTNAPANATELQINDLVSDSNYKICVIVKECEGLPPQTCIKCRSISTIPLIRNDSLLALFATIGALILLIVIGYICWRCAKKRKGSGESENEADEDILREGEAPNLLSVPSRNGPRRSVEFENEDIPYITPPIDTLSKDDRDKASNAPGTYV